MSMRRALLLVPVIALMCALASPAFAGGAGKGAKPKTNVRVKNETEDQDFLVAATNTDTPAETSPPFRLLAPGAVAQFKVNRGVYFVTLADPETEEFLDQAEFATGKRATTFIALELDEEGNLIVVDQTRPF